MNREIARFLKRIRLGRPIESYPVTITSALIAGQRLHFCTNLDRDPVQRKHRKGVFYEADELAALAALFPKGGTFVDIGAHAGNHTLYATQMMQAGKVIPFEPHAPSYRLLIQNVLLNSLEDRVDLSNLGCALGSSEEEGASMKSGRHNPAAARLKTKGGDIAIRRGDVLLADEMPDMIKIDVSGMEMEVLEGLSALFARCTPTLHIEVAAANDVAFQAWMKSAGYVVQSTRKRNKHDLNYLLVHKDAAKVQPASTKKTPVKKSSTAKKTAPKTVAATPSKTGAKKAQTSRSKTTTAPKPASATAATKARAAAAKLVKSS